MNKRFLTLVFIGAFLIQNAASSNRYPDNLAWLFGRAKNAEENSKENTRPSVCQTEECKAMANMLINSMNKSVDPCDDFYEYACGKWPEHNPIPKGKKAYTMFTVLQKKTNEKMQELLNAESDDSELLKLARKWHQACADIEAMDKRGLEPLVTTLARAGGWPIVMKPNEWNEEEYTWQKVDDLYMRLTGRNSLYDVRIDDDTIHIATPHLPPGSRELKEELMSNDDDDDDDGDDDDDDDDDDSDADESDEDVSDEEKQSNEQDSNEPGSEGENDSKNKDDNDDDEDDDNDDDDDDDYDDDDDDDDNDEEDKTNEQDNDEEITKEIRNKNKKSERNSKRISNSKISKKHNGYKKEKQRIIRQATTRKVNNKHVQRFTRHRKVLRAQRDKKKYVRKQLKKQIKESLASMEATASTTSRASTEEPDNNKNASLLQLYADHIMKVAQLVAAATGNEVSEILLLKDIEDMLEFQLALIKITSPQDWDIDLTLDDETLDGFQEWYDKQGSKTPNNKIDWVYKIELLFDEANVPVSDEVESEVGSPKYFEALVSLLDKTSSRTIVNYVHWNFVSRMLDTTTSEVRKINDAWLEDIGWPKRPSNRSDICMASTEIYNILAYEYVKNYFSDNIVTTATDMLDDIQKEVEFLIKASGWLNHRARDYALDKLTHMRSVIGYPDWYKNTTYMQRFFHGLVVGNSFFENKINYNKYVKWKSLRKLVEDDTTQEFPVDPAMVNAFFIPWKNYLIITAADFQSPFFAYDRPLAINYGIIGFIMAHEVNHAYDNRGHLFNKHGIYLDWLSAMAKSYGKKGECFVEQFNNYSIDKKTNLKIKNYGNQTAGDNIADTMGLQATYKAFKRRQRECTKPDPALPGLEDLTDDQLFFLSSAYLWCENIDPEELIKIFKKDAHSPGRLRVIGSVSNSEDFAKAYNCPVNSPMNPEKKCNVWQ